jgi:hypothetical protein
MRGIIVATVASMFIYGCAGEELKTIERGQIHADTLIVYDNGSRTTIGEQVLSENGDFAPAGPIVVYVIRNIPAPAAAQMKKDGLKIKPHTAYQLEAGISVNKAALKKMQPLGVVDAALTEGDVIALFE